MTYKNLEIVALNHDIPEYGLKNGNTGTIVDVYEGKNTYEVEFMTDEGKTIAVLTLDVTEIRSLTEINFKPQNSDKSDKISDNSPVGNLLFTLSYYSNTYNDYI